MAATITGFSAPTTTPSPELGTPRKAAFPITVPLIYEGRQVGTSGIPAGDTIRVIPETTTSMTLWYMNKEVTVPTPEAAKPVTITTVPAGRAASSGTNGERAILSMACPRGGAHELSNVRLDPASEGGFAGG